ncbi:MAG: SdpI family protein [Pseudomonadota bacterium]
MIRTGLFWSFLIIMCMGAGSVYGVWQSPPGESIAVQWSIDGTSNRFVDRNTGLFLLPTSAFLVSMLFAIAPAIDPRRENLLKNEGLYLTAWIGGIGLVALSHAAIVASAVSGNTPAPIIILLGVSGFIVLVGNLMAKSKSNFFVGIRNPWTLSSHHAWSVGNRTAGWGFVLSGLIAIGCIVAGQLEPALFALLIGVGASVVIATIASYIAWRQHRAIPE